MSAATKLLDILACPRTRKSLAYENGRLHSSEGYVYSIDRGVPILLPDGATRIEHEGVLETWPGYEPAIDFVLRSLPPNEPILDLGSGNRSLDRPQIIRMDVCRTPHVDVIGDAHALPFRDETLSFVYATAVFEHLRRPFEAAQEIWRVLKPGGYVLVDCNFVFPFHGYPAVYFNASGEGLRQLFHQFTELELCVAPWQMPSFALEAFLREYLRVFPSQSEQERNFVKAVESLLSFPLREFDERFQQKDAQRIAAAVSFMGIKQPSGTESLLPDRLLKAWQDDPALRQRFPRPFALLDLEHQRLDNLFHWAKTEGASTPALAGLFNQLAPFRKSL